MEGKITLNSSLSESLSMHLMTFFVFFAWTIRTFLVWLRRWGGLKQKTYIWKIFDSNGTTKVDLHTDGMLFVKHLMFCQRRTCHNRWVVFLTGLWTTFRIWLSFSTMDGAKRIIWDQDGLKLSGELHNIWLCEYRKWISSTVAYQLIKFIWWTTDIIINEIKGTYDQRPWLLM